MKKQQAVNLRRELHDTTDKETVYRRFDNKSGYAGKRTLIRFAQVDQGLQQAWSLPELATRTGWSETHLTKVVGWWQEEFGGNSPTNQGKGPIASLEVRSATDPSEDAERRRKHQEVLLAPLATLTGIEPLPIDHTDQTFTSGTNKLIGPYPRDGSGGMRLDNLPYTCAVSTIAINHVKMMMWPGAVCASTWYSTRWSAPLSS